jgi:prefoldin subunit 5
MIKAQDILGDNLAQFEGPAEAVEAESTVSEDSSTLESSVKESEEKSQETEGSADSSAAESEPSEVSSEETEEGEEEAKDIESQGSDEKSDAKSEHVPLKRYVAEKKKWKQERQELEDKVAKLTQVVTQVIQQMQSPQQPQQPQQPPQEPPPDPLAFTTNPEVYKLKETYDKEINQLKAYTAQQQAKEVARQVFMRIGQIEKEFSQEHPDYYDALNHIRARTRDAISTYKPDASDAEMGEFLMQQDLKFTQDALNAGIRPAEYVYTLAQKLYGYQPKNGEEKIAEQTLFQTRKMAEPVSKGLQKGVSTQQDLEESDEMDSIFGVIEQAKSRLVSRVKR